ncbi:hypothetical protein B0G75_104253 [Paraburkholderia sp. BL18I3N2]|uniref:hypothetical protein n=1 Tax=Paraburkholderia sp. BL18I3N2 TaxID=1938799 RepID=UPI000D0701E7|nr:hypothetical protein [Paraburkholderia sp. BL18I3N2]PRX32232.1 hypothetical protein B0G75_104253 [Paraburkholderia sp. BL18I3N2]
MLKKLPTTDASGVDNSSAVDCRSPGLGELTILLRPSDIAMAVYVGTRAQLEGEGVIPPGTEWPTGFASVCWQANGIDFCLKRERPEGAKGRQREFVECDNWWLRVTNPRLNWPDESIRLQYMKLGRLLYQRTQEGIAALNRQHEMYWSARRDEKYQAFKALIPGLVPPPRKRRNRRTQSEVGHD